MINTTEEKKNETSENTDANLSFSKYLEVLSLIDGKTPPRSVVFQRTMEIVSDDISKGNLPSVIRTMLVSAGVDGFLPPQYAKFRKVVLEGAVYLITHLSRERIVDKIVDQLTLPMDADSGKRICTLVKDMPTLHKLSQIIGRSPGVEEDFKKSLVDLEDNMATVTFKDLSGVLVDDLVHGKNSHPAQSDQCRSLYLELEENILAEASVCAVIPAKMYIELPTQMNSKKIPGKNNDFLKSPKPVVCKMVKPFIKKNMAAELALWGHLGEYLDENKDEWGLGNFQFKGTIDQVSWLLQNEVDLHLEQKNLEAVSKYYSAEPSVYIPQKMPFSTPNVTVMTRLDGTKITDVSHLSLKQRRSIAKKVTQLCILRPIIDLERESIFHGDPHAGNIAYRFRDNKPEIIFYDWAMVGRLSRLERMAVVLMISGLIAGNSTLIYYAADIMSGGTITSDSELGKKVMDIVSENVESRGTCITGVLSSVESLIEQIMYLGVVFSPDLLVFEKSLVTLKGVLADIDPDFDRDEYVVLAAVLRLASDVAHFRLQGMIIHELWNFYKYSISLFFDVQKAILKFGWDMVRV
ncbi:ABC1 family protein [Desulfamplus magnetovallimortis]|uniref:ABC1 family protein n=1 Tax=Desulfamplus magnetovallimortis TaxID=1246637 RepID=A0A1W1H7U8_9BACT|nr:AarF/UbiB family protein [Desulfamplus magnetovallimortis]SLM28560.1 ABC1 family protein [Desulfamplus magnetovallimortis]